MKATRSPAGETRGLPIHPLVFHKHLPDGILEPDFATLRPNDGEILAIRRPVRPLDILQDVPGGAPGNGNPGERPASPKPSGGVAVEGHGDLAEARDREDLGARETEGTRFRALEAADEDLYRIAVPGRGVHDGGSVRGKARRQDLAAAERELAEGGRRLVPRLPTCQVSRYADDESRREDHAGDEAARRGVSLPPRTAPATAPVGRSETLESASRSNATSRADSNRSSGFFSRQCRTIRSSPGWTSLFVCDRSGGSFVRIAVIVSAAVSPRNARWPDSIS